MKDLLWSVLNATSTRREAKSYISRFSPSPPPVKIGQKVGIQGGLDLDLRELNEVRHSGVNLGCLYALDEPGPQPSPFLHGHASRAHQKESTEPVHVALIKIRNPQLLEEETLKGIGGTLSQLRLLGLSSVVVVDNAGYGPFQEEPPLILERRRSTITQADRIVAAIASIEGTAARKLDTAITISPKLSSGSAGSPLDGLYVASRDQVLAPLRRGIIPVIAPIAYDSSTHSAVSVDANDVVLALAKELAGISALPADKDPVDLAAYARSLQAEASLDKIIVLDPLGGIPSTSRRDGSHVFINMEQEYEDIKDELSDAPNKLTHLRNLDLVRQTLALLPPSSSALLMSPSEATDTERSSGTASTTSGVGSRRRRNPLVHNLLTDKPSFSSSLPEGRAGFPPTLEERQALPRASPTTFVKRGMPLTILPAPLSDGWHSIGLERKLLLSDARIDLPRLIHLIEDSFSRKLDVEHYLSRVNDRLAGLIIAGEYEGCALFTWEEPIVASGDCGERLVPYLDKFAVLQRSQGAGGVADILFTAMVRTCLPSGVCWRSRRDNPVNKWYFERARGAWKMADSNWTMFWTTPDVETDGQLFSDYEDVCRRVEPSWAHAGAVTE
ncbi:MAG: Amino-acid acetyltransferase, mitochondrial [Thelocarpon superellum]|nr:MAG: Amino-acid acetyltransferase, mitochondrial [Thelocarpon superellum]